MKVTVNIDGRKELIDVVRQGDHLRITRAGQTMEARLLYRDGPYFVLEYESREDGRILRKQIRAAGVTNGDQRQLWVNGRQLSYERLHEGRMATGGRSAGTLAASIPAVVADVLVEPGDRVTVGQKLLLLESMKMVIPIQAPHDGQVVAVHCEPGDAVQPGVQLVELEIVD